MYGNNQIIFYLLVLTAFSLLTNPIFSQKKYYNLLEKKKYGKVEKKAGQDLEKDPKNVILLHIHALIYSSRDYKDYNTKKSYDYLIQTKLNFNLISDENEKSKLAKNGLSTERFENDLDTICIKALTDVISKSTINDYNDYLEFYKLASSYNRNKATNNRNSLAFNDAENLKTVEGYQYFIDTYPKAIEIPTAISNRNELAYREAENINSEQSYQYFIDKYPQSEQLNNAISKRNKFAYDSAKKINTAQSYLTFLNKYPNSNQASESKTLYEERLFTEETEPSNYLSYGEFIKSYPNNHMVSVAIDSLIEIGVNKKLVKSLKIAMNNCSGEQYNRAILGYYNIYTDDGESETLNNFLSEYTDFPFQDILDKDISTAILGDDLDINQAFISTKKDKYSEYIKIAAPKEKAFVALQRLISLDIGRKNWSSASKTIKEFEQYFRKNDKKLKNLLEILDTKWDNTILVTNVGSGINTQKGGEYVPILTADNKLLYFCGCSRSDNIGGEDIFLSKNIKNTWSQAKIVSDLSSIFSNDAPLSITTDGITMLTFKSGKINFSSQTYSGWTDMEEFPEPINEGRWNADAMMTSDGNAIIFSSIRPGNMNYYEQAFGYHGSNEHQTDIYVCEKTSYGWSEPINLGAKINTIYSDRSPFLHPDMKTLYFSSDGHGGIGKLDVFMSTRLADTCWDCWSEPLNLGKEINTEESDWGYRITTDGKKAYFAANKTTLDENDIYFLNLPPHLRPDLVATVTGKLVDINQKPVSATIRWEDLNTGKNVGQSQSNPSDGSFFIVLPLGKIYGYYVDKDEYFPISNSVDLRTTKESVEVEENIDMVTFKQMIDDGSAVPVNNLFFNIGENELLPYSIPELKRVADIIKRNKIHVEIAGHTDNIGEEKSNIELSIKRANAVRDFLIEEDCPVDYFTVVGYGETRPIASNDSEAGRDKNRRVELRFINKEE